MVVLAYTNKMKTAFMLPLDAVVLRSTITAEKSSVDNIVHVIPL